MKYCEDGFGVSDGFFDVLDAVDDVELWMLVVHEQAMVYIRKYPAVHEQQFGNHLFP